MSKNLREKMLEGLNEIFDSYKATPTVQNAISVSILIPDFNMLLIGVPGTGKTTLIRMISKAFFGDSFEKVSFSQNVTPFDIFFYLNLGKLSKGIEEISSRPILQARARLFNELGRASPSVQNELLELLEERQKSWRGHIFKAPAGINFFDMNPMDATSTQVSNALLDRMDISLAIPTLNMKQEFELLYVTSKFSTNLVDNMNKIMNATEMQKVWEEVDKIQVPPSEMFFITLLRSMMSMCGHFDRSIIDSNNIQQKCQECTYKGEVCSQIKKVPSFRISKSTSKIAKAIAYLKNNSEVQHEDILKAFALALPHRIQLLPQFRNQFGNENEWVKQKFFQAVDTKQRLWREAAKKFSDALKGNKTAKKQLKELCNKDIAIYSAYQSWFENRKNDIFDEIVW